MASMTIRKRLKVGGVLTNASVASLGDASGGYGVRRLDTGAVVVAAGVGVTNVSTGLYSYSIADVVAGVEYVYSFHFVTAEGQSIYVQGSKRAPQTGNLYDLLPQVAPYVSDCPAAVVKQQLRAAAWDFFQETEVWQEALSAIDSEEDEDTYALETDYAAVIVRVRKVEVDEVDQCGRFTVNAAGSELTLLNVPAEDDLAIVPYVTFKPLESCVEYPSWLLGRWGYPIVRGALWRLLSMEGEAWYRPRLAMQERAEFDRAVGRARWETVTELGPAEQRVVPVRMF